MRPRVTKGGAAFVAIVTAGWIGLAGPASALFVGSTSVGAVKAAAPALGGWNTSADGNVVDILMDNTTGLAGVHPFSEADFPEAESQFATGPFGSGLATVFWPGSAGGNFGSLSAELGFPPQLAAITSHLNDPVRASASYPAGPASASYPAGASGGAAVMKSTADETGTTAEGSITNEAPSTVLAFRSATGTSGAHASDKASAQASTALSGVKLLGGIIDIGSITSTAQASSDGSTGTGSATTNVTGVTILGQKTTIGSTGITIPNFPSSVGLVTGPIIKNAISQVISGLGLTITEFPAVQAAKGTGYTATSGGVSIEFDPPSSAAPTLEAAASVLAPAFPSQAAIIPTLPGLLQGFKVTITLGRATASANASPGFNSPDITVPTSAAGGFTTPPVSTGSSDSGTVTPAPGADPTGSSAPATGSTATASGTPSSPAVVSAPAATLVRLSSPLGAGAVVLGILATLALGFGLWSVARMLLPSDAEPVCPLGRD